MLLLHCIQGQGFDGSQWEKVKKAGMAPQPRTSFGLAVHKNRAILFGGVADQAGKGDRIYSQNFDEMYQFNMEPHLRRWFPVSMRAAAKSKVSAAVSCQRLNKRLLSLKESAH